MKTTPSLILVLIFVTNMWSCSLHDLARDQVTQTTLAVINAYDREHDVEFARRALPASLKMLDGAVLDDPDNPILLTAASRAYARYAWGFTELEIEQAHLDGDSASEIRARIQAADFYRRSVSYGYRALACFNPAFASDSLDEPSDFKSALNRLDSSEAKTVYWTAFSLGNLLSLEHNPDGLLSKLAAVRLMLERVIELNSDFLSGLASAYLGALSASLPPLLGQDFIRAKEHFDASKNFTDSCYLAVELTYVRYYLRRTVDASEYRSALRGIIDSTCGEGTEWALDNAVTRRRAVLYLNQADRQKSETLLLQQ